MSKPKDVTGVILAGGEGRRMGGEDKGWVPLQGLPLIQRAIERLQPQVEHIVISANRNLAAYEALGYPIYHDNTPYLGPLGGIAACLKHIETEYALVVPTDAPLIPLNLVETLCRHRPAKLILCEDQRRLQPLFGLYHRSLATSIDDFLQAGDRKLTLWCERQHPTRVTIGDNEAFTNLNTPSELSEFEKNLPT
ncbi:molybdenum cofactor guanylyltransferase MobA [Ketobacter sp.]|uniref:molybdenum cofactor guanylyltransferase MobA n=1 Tax=Ketobacter sp. TaxID=2083498 RepID=UPI000F16EA89|nr:molybdenum cofactor guanylyltransferase MobA [Ketobacter sp.]RLT92640.1 MAG: molybdenum cofactor guanylyltransferase [Ketobacter sp.]